MPLNIEKTNPELGRKVHEHLVRQGVETPMVERAVLNPQERIDSIATHFTHIMSWLGMDLTDDSMAESPIRVSKMYVNELMWGLNPDNFPKCTVVENKMGYDEMVLEKGIQVISLCEHHFQTISGTACVAYIPKNKVLGLSKLGRVVEYFSRRPQIQERLTEQVYHALSYILETDNIAVLINAEHYCIKARGLQQHGSTTITSKLGGAFKEESALRAEFFSAANM
jgi:GTP cyclohydrolase I